MKKSVSLVLRLVYAAVLAGVLLVWLVVSQGWHGGLIVLLWVPVAAFALFAAYVCWSGIWRWKGDK